jgi:hypothetical protein
MTHHLRNQVSFVSHLSLFRLENRVYLSHGVQVAGAAWRAAMRIVVRVGDVVQRIRDGRTVLSGRAVGWRCVRSAPGTWRLGARISWLSLKTKVNGL